MGTELKKELDPAMLDELDLLMDFESVKETEPLNMARELPEEDFGDASTEKESEK